MKYPSDPTPAQQEAEKLRMDLTAALSSERRLREAILWALGENGDFRPRADADRQGRREGPYYWRRELRERALTTPAACPDLVLVGREEWERIQGTVLFGALGSRLVKRVMAAADFTTPDACDVELSLVRIISERDSLRIQKQVTEAGLKGGGESPSPNSFPI